MSNIELQSINTCGRYTQKWVTKLHNCLCAIPGSDSW